MNKLVPVTAKALIVNKGSGARDLLAAIDMVRQDLRECQSAINQCDPWSTHHHAKMAVAIQEARQLIAAEWWTEALAQLDQAQRLAPEALIRVELANLVSAFPNGAKAELQNYGRQLAVHVTARTPSVFALTTACWKLIETCRFVPTIAEVIAAIDAAQENAARTWQLAQEFPEKIEGCARRLADCQEAMNRKKHDEERAHDESPAGFLR